jgi:hypothetical protein
MLNHNNDSEDLKLEKEFTEAVKMLEQAQKTAKDKQLMDIDLRESNADLRLRTLDLKEEIISLRDENVVLKEEIKKLKGETRQIDLSERDNLFFADGIKTPVCYNCSMEKGRPVVLGKVTGIQYKCSVCKESFLYQPESTELVEKINMFG